MTDAPHQPRRLILLGSTGSIGTQTLECLRNLDGRFRVVGIAAGSNHQLLAQQVADFDIPHVALCNPAPDHNLSAPHLYTGPDAAAQLVDALDADILVNAIVGAAGLPATVRAIEKGMTIALANKETLVTAGQIVMPLAQKHNVPILPIDSEHSAIFQCIQSHAATHINSHLKRIVLTASGGPFRTWTKDQIQNATIAQALNHPTWDMGTRITIDSATMMNKALEIIEAHWLFDLPADRIDVIIHPQSIAHSFVEFTDHSILAQLGTPDMRTPIQYALTWPDRFTGAGDPLDWSTLRTLDFEPPDHDRFPALPLAYRVIETGGTSGAVLNAAKEAAVDAFLDANIPFGRIVQLVETALDRIPSAPADDLQTVLDADAQARQLVRSLVATPSKAGF